MSRSKPIAYDATAAVPIWLCGARLITISLPPRLDAYAFPKATPLRAFFAWNEARHVRDRRYVIACDIHRLLRRFQGEIGVCLAHLAGQSIIRWRAGVRIGVSASRLFAARELIVTCHLAPVVAAARRLVDGLLSSIGANDIARHAAVFRSFDDLAGEVDLDALARLRPAPKPAARPPREILIIKLGALGDFIQAQIGRAS